MQRLILVSIALFCLTLRLPAYAVAEGLEKGNQSLPATTGQPVTPTESPASSEGNSSGSAASSESESHSSSESSKDENHSSGESGQEGSSDDEGHED